MKSIKRTARIAGLWYLFMGIGTGFSMGYVDSKLYTAGDMGATVNNILASQWLFLLGFMSNFAGLISFLFLANSLYKLLVAVDRGQARLMFVFIIAGVSITFLNMINQFASVKLLSGAAHLSAFEPAQLQTVAMVFLDMHKSGKYIAGIFWGLWLFPLGMLFFKSGFIPKVLSVLLMIGCFGYLINSLTFFFYQKYEAIIFQITTTPAGIAEILCILWLLIKGVKDQQPALSEAI